MMISVRPNDQGFSKGRIPVDTLRFRPSFSWVGLIADFHHGGRPPWNWVEARPTGRRIRESALFKKISNQTNSSSEKMKATTKLKTRSRIERAVLGITVVSLLAVIGGVDCPGEVGNPAVDPVNAVNEFLTSLPKWSEFSPPLPDVDPGPTDMPPGDPTDEIVMVPGDTGNATAVAYSCRTQEYSMTRTPEKIVMYSPDAGLLWPGALIQGISHRDGLGSLLGLTIEQRTPLEVTIAGLLAGDSSRLVENPTLGKVTSAIGSMIEGATTSGLVSGTTISFQEVTYHSEEEFGLKLGVSGRYLNLSGSVKAEFNASANETTVATQFIEKMFTVAVSPPQTPGGFFSAEFTKAILDEQIALGRIGPNNLPVYVAEVVYGRMMTFAMTSTASETEMKAALQAQYSGIAVDVSAEATLEYKRILSQSRTNIFTLGGTSGAASAMIATGDLKEYFTEDAPLTSAVPLSYIFRNLGDGSIASVTEATSYSVKECQPTGVLAGVTCYKDLSVWRDVNIAEGLDSHEYNYTCGGSFPRTTPMQHLPLQDDSFTLFGDGSWAASGSFTGLPLDFYLQAKEPGARLVLNEHSGCIEHIDTGSFSHTFLNGATCYELDNRSTFGPCRDASGFHFLVRKFISIGRVSLHDIDSFEIGVTGIGVEVHAIGIFVDNNDISTNERLIVYDKAGNIVFDKNPCNGADVGTVFMGVISPTPISRIEFVSDAAFPDSIQVNGFHFGVK